MNSPVSTPPVQRRGAFEFAGKWRQRVCDLPQTGMGYVVVSVELRDVRTFDQVVIDSGYRQPSSRAAGCSLRRGRHRRHHGQSSQVGLEGDALAPLGFRCRPKI